MAQPKKIRATCKNGVIEPLEKLNLPEGQELELEFKVLPLPLLNFLSPKRKT